NDDSVHVPQNQFALWSALAIWFFGMMITSCLCCLRLPMRAIQRDGKRSQSTQTNQSDQLFHNSSSKITTILWVHPALRATANLLAKVTALLLIVGVDLTNVRRIARNERASVESLERLCGWRFLCRCSTNANQQEQREPEWNDEVLGNRCRQS